MGNVHTPKTKYFENGVVEFFVHKKIIFFNAKFWLKDGLTQFTFKQGIYESDDQIDKIIKEALLLHTKTPQQSFGDGIRN